MSKTSTGIWASTEHQVRRRSISLAVAALALGACATAIAWAQASGVRFRPDGWKSDEYGRAEGYPADRAKGSQKKYLVGTFSLWDTLVPVREIAASGEAAPLERAPREPMLRYKAGDATRTLDHYLDQHPITGLLIARGDRILVERYQYDRRETHRFNSQSMAKTITALLIGIALRDGSIRSLDDTAETYVAGLRGSEFGKTPLRALLQMSSGIRFTHSVNEDGELADTAVLNRVRLRSILKAVLQFNDRVAPPGTRFNYTSAETLVLGLVLTAATRRTIGDYAREKLWGPLGAEASAAWRVDASGQELTACCFGARLRDYARLGLMMAHDGAWRGRQIVPRDWLIAMTSVGPADRRLRTVSQKSGLGYGYQTWLLPDPGRQFMLRGFRGQEVIVDPRTRTVLVQSAVWPVGEGNQVLALWRGVLASLR